MRVLKLIGASFTSLLVLGFMCLFSVHAAEKVQVGIIPLDYGQFKNLQIYASGTQDTLIKALGTLPELQVIDRTRTSDVIKEISNML